MTGRWVAAGTGPCALQDWPPAEKHRAYRLIVAAVDDLRRQHGDRLVVMSGMALGFDKALAVAALQLGVPLWCAIPNRGYGRYYWGRQYGEFQRIVGDLYLPLAKAGLVEGTLDEDGWLAICDEETADRMIAAAIRELGVQR